MESDGGKDANQQCLTFLIKVHTPFICMRITKFSVQPYYRAYINGCYSYFKSIDVESFLKTVIINLL